MVPVLRESFGDVFPGYPWPLPVTECSILAGHLGHWSHEVTAPTAEVPGAGAGDRVGPE